MKTLLLFGAIALSVNVFGQAPNYVPPIDLVGWWGFNGNANDASGNGNSGTVNGATLTTDRFGNPNSAYYFDGASNSISGDASSFPTGERTISFWYKTNLDQDNYFLSYGGGVCGTSCIIYANANACSPSLTSLEYSSHCCSNFFENNYPSNNLGNWHHIILISSASGSTFYFDGLAFPTSGPSLNTNVVGKEFYFAATVETNGIGVFLNNYFDGLLDDIGIWSRALAECEIQELYNSETMNVSNTVTQVGAQLTADYSGAIYQWLDCDNANAQIIGETNQSYTPTVTGNYSVEITSNGCVDTSVCMLVDFTGLDEINNSTIKVYPNPTNASFNIEVDINVVGSNYFIFDQLGKVVQKGFISSASQILDVAELSKGIYNLTIDNSDIRVKLIKE